MLIRSTGFNIPTRATRAPSTLHPVLPITIHNQNDLKNSQSNTIHPRHHHNRQSRPHHHPQWLPPRARHPHRRHRSMSRPRRSPHFRHHHHNRLHRQNHPPRPDQHPRTPRAVATPRPRRRPPAPQLALRRHLAPRSILRRQRWLPCGATHHRRDAQDRDNLLSRPDGNLSSGMGECL